MLKKQFREPDGSPGHFGSPSVGPWCIVTNCKCHLSELSLKQSLEHLEEKRNPLAGARTSPLAAKRRAVILHHCRLSGFLGLFCPVPASTKAEFTNGAELFSSRPVQHGLWRRSGYPAARPPGDQRGAHSPAGRSPRGSRTAEEVEPRVRLQWIRRTEGWGVAARISKQLVRLFYISWFFQRRL